jgi:hypothetical protein
MQPINTNDRETLAQSPTPQNSEVQADIVLPFTAVDRTSLPAVIGVLGATEHIATGQHITVDGSNGIVSLEK